MDYKYIEQLLERYWACETSLEEEEILRMFFSQKDVPASLIQYQALFTYEHLSRKDDALGDDFDQKILQMIDEPASVKARVITMRQRLMPLFKAAAIVAIILTLGNAMQVPFSAKENADNNVAEVEVETQHEGPSVAVAKADTIKLDTLQQGTVQQPPGFIK